MKKRKRISNFRARIKQQHNSILIAILLISIFIGSQAACTTMNGSSSAEAIITEDLEAEKSQDYVLSLSIEQVQADRKETARIRKMYAGSELAQENGWTDEYLAQNMIAVKAEYTVDYDNTQVPFTEGHLQQYFYLTRADQNAPWTIWDAMSPGNMQ